ncbi:MAG: hypothetical protein ABI592_01680 [Acidobacteriota bacterium]
MSPRQRSIATALGVALLFALPLLPEILGSRVLVFRDAQITHWPWRRVAMQSLDAGRTPFLNPSASGTQPLLANPNAVLLYPTVLLEKLVPAVSAFNLHYLLHVLWAFLGARLLASRLGVSPGAAAFSGVAYAFSGMMLSYGSAFMNSAASAAWLPWCAAAALGVSRATDFRGVLRASAATGLAFGLQLLGGEPALCLLTGAFTAFLALSEVFAQPDTGRPRRLAFLALGGTAAILVAAGLAAALLLPLRAVFPLTYRGQHLYSETAFGAAPFLRWRVVEWLFPRFGGDPAALGSGASWLQSVHEQDLVYIWCVSFGVLPLLALALGALRREFWNRRSIAIAAAGLTAWIFSFGFGLPLYRLLFAVGFLRRLRYPIKFYLLTTICVALLAGFAADALRRSGRRRRDAVALGAVLLLYAAAFFAARPGGLVDARMTPRLIQGSLPHAAMLEAIRGAVRGDALLGALAALLLGVVVFSERPDRPGRMLAFLALVLALPWALPLFVSASVHDLLRPPALVSALAGEGRVYTMPEMPGPDFEVLQRGRRGLPRFERVARTLVEDLIPATAQPFGVRYLFDHDPDGSYSWYNRVASEAAIVSSPVERSRLLRVYGARWALAAEGEPFPLFHPVTGVIVAGRHLVLHALDSSLPEVRWAGRDHRRASLSGAIELLRSDRFEADRDVVLPGPDSRSERRDPSSASLSIDAVTADGASGTVDAAGAGHVVFARTWFPAWRAQVDGAPARVLVANARDLAIAVAPGRHRFAFAWDRRPFHRGVMWQAVALLAALAAGVATAPRR